MVVHIYFHVNCSGFCYAEKIQTLNGLSYDVAHK